MTAPTNPTEKPAAAPRPGRRRLITALVIVLALSPGAAHWAWRSWTAPQPPVLRLGEVDPPVARAAEEALREVAAAPRSAAAWGRLGMVLCAHDFYDEAHACFAQAERLDRHDVRWPYLQGVSFGNPDPDKVVPPLERAVKLAGGAAVPRLRLGEVLLEQGRYDEAERLFREALGGAALDDARAHLGLGRAFHGRGDGDSALTHLLRSAELAPNVRATHALLAEIYHRRGDAAAAEEARERAAALPPDAAWPDPYLAEVVSFETGPVALVRRANSLHRHGDTPRALALLRQITQAFPDSADAHFTLGRVLTDRKEGAAAESSLREAARLKPDAVEAHLYLGVALEQQGKLDEAAASYRKAAEAQPRYARAHFELGQCLYKLGDRPRAAEAFREAVRHKRDYARAHLSLGLLLAETGQQTEALKHLQQAVDLNPHDENARLALDRVRRAGRP